MTKKESDCVGCQKYCLYESCPYYRVEVKYCDVCGDYADCTIDGEDFCLSCAENKVNKMFHNLSFEEKQDNLGLDHLDEDVDVFYELSIDEKCDVLGLDYEEV